LNHVSQLNAPTTVAKESNSSICLFHALVRGSLGFAAVSVAGFAVWAFGGRWLRSHVGELGLYLACAFVFIALSGLTLHPLVRGPKSLLQFYKIFLPAFGAYAIAWSAAWFALRFGPGEWLGSLTGSMVLSAMIARGFRTFRSVFKVSSVIFVLHSAGYFLGGQLMRWMMSTMDGGLPGSHNSVFPKLAWGLLYGLGLGAGLGYAFFTFQSKSAVTTKTPTVAD
jgi:hypothetical protein